MPGHKIAVIALAFLLAGGLKPVCNFAAAVFSDSTVEVSTLSSEDQQGEEEDSLKGIESDSEEEGAKLMVSPMIFSPNYTSKGRSFVAYLLIFKEHHPDLLTPPPRG